MTLSEDVKTTRPRKRIKLRILWLVLVLFTSPLCCLGSAEMLAVLPLPGIFDLFHAEAAVQNNTAGTVYLTPITTTRGYPQVIRQVASLRQCQVPAAPGESVTLTYDSADFPLSGVAVCQGENDCRLLEYDYGRDVLLDSYQTLPELDAGWQEAAQACKPFNVTLVLLPMLALVPLGAFVAWVVLTVKEKRTGRKQKVST